MVNFNEELQVESVYGNYTKYPKIEQMKAVIEYAKKYIRKHKNEEAIEFLNYKAEKEMEERVKKAEQEMREQRRLEKSAPMIFMTNIYLIFDTVRSVYKIGKAGNAVKRFDQLKTANAGIKLICSYYADEKVERFLHGHFKSKRVSGEWFDLNDHDLICFHGFFGKLSATITEYKSV